MIEENIVQPNELLTKYKEYEYILNVDRKELTDSLFAGEKKPLAEIKEQIAHYDRAYKEIMTCSEDDIDFNIFKVVTKKLKTELGDQAAKTRDKILEATYNWCNETVVDVRKTYTLMFQKIDHDPVNERELIETRDFISKTPQEVERLTDILREVQRHHEMLESFSYMYKETDIDGFWMMKIWPLRI